MIASGHEPALLKWPLEFKHLACGSHRVPAPEAGLIGDVTLRIRAALWASSLMQAMSALQRISSQPANSIQRATTEQMAPNG